MIVNLNFLPQQLRKAVGYLNQNFLSEIRIRKGQPVIIEYFGEYQYINDFGHSRWEKGAIIVDDVQEVLNAAMHSSVYAYSEQLKRGFISADGGIRIGVCGEYVTESGKINAVRGVTSLNIRIPHCVDGCGKNVLELTQKESLHSTLLFSRPGFGKTTMLRDIAKTLGGKYNVLVFDERCEISAIDSNGRGYNLGVRCDIIRGGDKLSAFPNAIRAMKPQIIVTDELYGDDDFAAVSYAADCGIAVFASTHVTDRSKLKEKPFDYFVELKGIGKEQIVYDKNFNLVGNYNPDDDCGVSAVPR